MSRETVYQDNRLQVIAGTDHMLGKFLQVFDQDMKDQTPEGEGLVLDWSEGFGTETDFTGLPKDLDPLQKALKYVEENKIC